MTTPGTSGPKWPAPLADWHPASLSWRTYAVTLDGDSAALSENFPASGMTRGGRLYERPTWAPPTDGSGSSSSPSQLIPTPLHSDAGPRGGTTGYGLRDWSRSLLPTPNASDTSKHAGQPAHKRKGRGHSTRIADVIECDLLPTPTAMDSHSSGGNDPSNVTLTDAVVRTSLGARTNPRFADGNEPSDELSLHLPS
jgi:hypothetical protein